MSEEKDPYKSEDPSWEEETSYNEQKLSDQTQPVQEYQYSAAPVQPVEEPIVLSEEEQARKTRRRRILIIIFAIITPVVLAATGLGFLIWGLVVGFTECANSCGDCFNTCCGCSESCNNCCDSCTDCGTTCDNCCSSDSISRSSRGVSSIKILFKNYFQIIQWYYYSLVEFLKVFFIK